MNLIDGGQILKPNLFRVRKTVLSVPDIGISSHLRLTVYYGVNVFDDPGFR